MCKNIFAISTPLNNQTNQIFTRIGFKLKKKGKKIKN